MAEDGDGESSSAGALATALRFRSYAPRDAALLARCLPPPQPSAADALLRKFHELDPDASDDDDVRLARALLPLCSCPVPMTRRFVLSLSLSCLVAADCGVLFCLFVLFFVFYIRFCMRLVQYRLATTHHAPLPRTHRAVVGDRHSTT